MQQRSEQKNEKLKQKGKKIKVLKRRVRKMQKRIKKKTGSRRYGKQSADKEADDEEE